MLYSLLVLAPHWHVAVGIGMEDSSSSGSEDETINHATGKIIRFTTAQRACLAKYWSNGLTGCGRRFAHQISTFPHEPMKVPRMYDSFIFRYLSPTLQLFFP